MFAGHRWVVQTSRDRDLAEIAAELAANGFTVDQVFNETGAIIGTAADDVVDALRTIRGVADISPEEQIDLGPPDSPITW
jgi:nickel-dependent lactate racemase